jgi:hypothetical protein
MSEQQLSETTTFTGATPSSDKIRVEEEIEKISLECKCDTLTAALELAKRLDWDPSWLAPYIKGAVKEKLRVEGESIGLLKRTQTPKVIFE